MYFLYYQFYSLHQMLDCWCPSECLSVGCAYHRQPSQLGLDYSPLAYEPPEHEHGLENLSSYWVALVAVHLSPYG